MRSADTKPSALLPRLVESRVLEALGDSPIVLIHGPRQSGKTTLAKKIGTEREYEYFTFDDDVLRSSADADPKGFVADLPNRAILDEVQRVPRLFTALKLAVDPNREPGRFLLTGSANVLMMPKLADSLAGRMEIIRLFPFAQAEMEKHRPRLLDSLFAGDFKLSTSERLGVDLAERIVTGGYPAAVARRNPRRRAAWYRDYVESIVQRDIRDFSNISSLDALPRLLALAAGQTARLINVADLSAPFQLSRPTIRDYVTLLRQVFLVDELPAWHSNRLKRSVKSAKLHIGDTGLASALMGFDAASLYEDREMMGQLLETFVYQELRRQASGRPDDMRFYHYRDRDQAEVDIVIERDGRRVAGVEVKRSATIGAKDFRGLNKLAKAAGERFAAGIVIYDGDTTVPFGDRLFAVPVRALWED